MHVTSAKPHLHACTTSLVVHPLSCVMSQPFASDVHMICIILHSQVICTILDRAHDLHHTSLAHSLHCILCAWSAHKLYDVVHEPARAWSVHELHHVFSVCILLIVYNCALHSMHMRCTVFCLHAWCMSCAPSCVTVLCMKFAQRQHTLLWT